MIQVGRRGRVLVVIASAVVAVVLLLGDAGRPLLACPGTTERVSVDSAGEQGNSDSYHPAISTDGRYVALTSSATNLVPNDTNQTHDVFIRDRQTGTTGRASVDSAGNQGNGGSHHSAISADGRYVAFDSDASNLVASDTNLVRDVFVHDRDYDEDGIFDEAGAISTVRVSVDSAGNQANGGSYDPAISADGRYVAFESFASNLVPGDSNDMVDVFVHDRDYDEDGILDETGAISTVRVSVDSQGNQGDGDSYYPAISADGRYVPFESFASNLVPNDTNQTYDVFVHDWETASTERVSVDSTGEQANNQSGFAAISADGRYVAFCSLASDLVLNDTNSALDVFVRDRQTASTERVSVDSEGNQGDGGSCAPVVSGGGRHVAFYSEAPNLAPGDNNDMFDVFVHDRQTGTTERVSVNSAGEQGNNHSGLAAISGDGRYAAFESAAYNLVPNDTNDALDVFVHDLGDADGDGEWDPFDNCPLDYDPDQTDTDLDGIGDVCDNCPTAANADQADLDVDGVGSVCDNCPIVYNPAQIDSDGDGVGNVCDFPVGGIADLPDVSDSSGRNYVALVAVAAAALVALSAGGWYARRRWLR